VINYRNLCIDCGRRYAARIENDEDWTPRRRHQMASGAPAAPAPAPAAPTAPTARSMADSVLGARLWTTWMLLIGTSLVTMFSLMVITLVLVYETDFHWAIHLRHWPEMVFIQRHLYLPFRSLFSLWNSKSPILWKKKHKKQKKNNPPNLVFI